MSKSKDSYHQALDRLKVHLQEPDQKQLVVELDRFNGEIRRKNGDLTRKMEELEAQISSLNVQIVASRLQAAQATTLQEEKQQLERLKRKLAQHNDELQARNNFLEPLAQQAQQFADVNDFLAVKVKCLECGLHFMVCTWHEDRHTAASLYCPECGQHNRHFLVWSEPGKGFIFQNVPGSAQLIDFKLPLERRNSANGAA